MEFEATTQKKELSYKWIQADSGNTYLCPVGALDKMEDPTEDQLKMYCVEESTNPHNN